MRQSIKGILRGTVQLLERHRDLEFLHVKEETAPISIIITTLAMQSYEMCVRRHTFADELEVLIHTIRLMPKFIERPLVNGHKIYAVWNETTDGENFAERWNEAPARVGAFYKWHSKVLSEFEALRGLVGLDAIIKSMKDSLGDKLVMQTINRRIDAFKEGRNTGALTLGAGVGLTTQKSATSTPVPKNEFYGD